MLTSGGIIGNNLGLGFGSAARNRQNDMLRKALESARVRKAQSWSYKGEEADYKYYRQTDKKTLDEEVRQKLELLHKWYPNKTLEELDAKIALVRSKFLSWFPKADMTKFVVLRHPDTGTNVFFGAWSVFGDTAKDEDKMANPELLKAIGLGSSLFPPKLIQNGNGRYHPPKSGLDGGCASLTKLRLWSSEKNSFVINFRNIFQNKVVTFKSASDCETWRKSKALIIGHSS